MTLPRGELTALAGAVVVETAIYVGYPAHDADYHWFMHFFIGAALALVGMAVWIIEERRPVRLVAVWPVLGHLVAMSPDFLFAFGLAHRQWMDIFLGHLSSEAVPGHNLTWYAAFLITLAGYLAADARLRAQRDAGRGRRRRRR